MRLRPALIILTLVVALVITGSFILQQRSGTPNDSATATTASVSASNEPEIVPVKTVPVLALPDPLPTRTLDVPILMYHRIAVLQGDEPAATIDMTVDPGEFTLQMQWLKDNDYTSITQLDLFNALESGKPLPPKPVLITFDDGYRGIATMAAPIMTRVGFVGTAYVITNRIATKRKTAPTWLTWPQLRSLEQRGWDIGSHTVSHQAIPPLTEAEAMKTLRASRSTLERHLGHPVQWFSYPDGRVSPTAVDQVRRAGYVLATTTKSGITQSAADPLQLNRIRISNNSGVRGLAAALSG